MRNAEKHETNEVNARPSCDAACDAARGGVGGSAPGNTPGSAPSSALTNALTDRITQREGCARAPAPAHADDHDDQSAAPLVRAVTEYAARNPRRFHMPGHKGKGGAALFLWPDGFLGPDGALSRHVTNVDVTEVEGLDDLHEPEGAIKEAESLAAQAYGADRTFFLVNGSTCGLHAAIMATCGPDDEVIVSRDTHVAVAGGLVLSGARPVYVVPEVDELFAIPLGPTVEALVEEIRRHPRARAVVLTSPNYYGVSPDIKTLVAAAHDYGRIAVVDEAHGAHLPFHEALPPSALEARADVVVSGAHKTLPAMTQASFLHLKGGAVDPETVRRMLRLVETTSPSYVLMASLDAARRVAAMRGRDLLSGVLTSAAAARERLSRLPGVQCLDGARLASRGFVHDPTKLVISFAGLLHCGVTGVEIARLLREAHGIWVELADARNVLAILTMADSQDDVDRLVSAIEYEVGRVRAGDAACLPGLRNDDRDRAAGRLAPETAACDALRHIPPLRMTPRQAAIARTEWVPVHAARGRIAADVIVPYPPGIPVLCPGEEITERITEFVRAALSQGGKLRLRGVRNDGSVLVVADR
jgi:arginine/lysine/ornithine decarboxylase